MADPPISPAVHQAFRDAQKPVWAEHAPRLRVTLSQGDLVTATNEAERAGIRAAITAWLAEQATGPHVYLSTGCLHGEHDYCAAMTGQQGRKRPATCKWCDARCICRCHDAPTEPAEPLAPVPAGATELDATPTSAGAPKVRQKTAAPAQDFGTGEDR